MALKFNASTKSVVGTPVPVVPRAARPAATRGMRIVAEARPEEFGRREALGMAAGLSAILAAKPAEAAYGEAANVFGKPTNVSGFIPYVGDGFSLLIPSKWNPSEERDFPGTVFRYEDNGDAVNHALVTITKTDKNAISDFGSESDFFKTISFYLGQQSYEGQTQSEGGFAADRVSTASLLDIDSTKKNGKTYYNYNILSRTADGDEGGRHVLLSATVSGGALYILKVQIGDKRWFKGAKTSADGLVNSFTVA
ncbi:hypothetical protein BSKO_10359 [Bryopsis sp. KO-2023]|nr:hypothetical protein BSKO_10359 [Bryopsis sp. KO-2023]